MEFWMKRLGLNIFQWIVLCAVSYGSNKLKILYEQLFNINFDFDFDFEQRGNLVQACQTWIGNSPTRPPTVYKVFISSPPLFSFGPSLSISFIRTPVLPSSSPDVLTGFRILFVDKSFQGLPLLSHPCLAGILLSTHFECGSLSESQIFSFKLQHCNFCCPFQYLQPCVLVQ